MTKLDWTQKFARPSLCPVCRNDSQKTAILTVSGYGDHTGQYWEPIDLVRCPGCSVLYYDPQISIEHDNSRLVKFYIEQGGGISVMLESLLMADGRPVETYLEIGCGFGFSLDYARRMLGWKVRGYDPSATAEAGRRMLDLPIAGEYFDQASEEIGNADLILCSEVIEHVPDPVAYLRLLRSALKPTGLLLLTTPNAACAVPGMAPELMTLLSPGGHLVLFTPEALRNLLLENGFPYLRMTEVDTQIRVAASMVPFSGEPQHYSRERYREYLALSVKSHPPGSALATGFAGRLLKEHVNTSKYDQAQVLYDQLRQGIRQQYGFDLEAPEDLVFPAAGELNLIEFGERWPFNLCAIWYCRGLLLLLAERQPAPAARMFAASARFGRIVRENLRVFGSDDGETAHLCREAELAGLDALAQSDPQAAVAAFETMQDNPLHLDPVMLAGHLDTARQRLFSNLVNLGHLDAATRIIAPRRFPTDYRVTRQTAGIALSYAHHLLNVVGDYPAAEAAFARVLEALDTEGLDAEAVPLRQTAEIDRLTALARFAPDRALAALDRLAADRPSASSGLASQRLFTDLVNLGHLDQASTLLPAVEPVALLPPTPETARLALAYGRYIVNVRADFAAAGAIFDRIAESLRSHAADPDCARLKREAELEQIGIVARQTPDKAAAALDSLARDRAQHDPEQLAAHLDRARKRLLCDLVNLGHLAAAEALVPSLRDRESWQVLNALAMIDLLHRHEPGDAAKRFALAFDLAREARAAADPSAAGPAELARIRHHEVVARLMASDLRAAAAAAGTLIGPDAEAWVPDEARAALEALLSEHPAVLDILSETAAAEAEAAESSGE